ncbi:MAG: hypothetical protein HY040_10510 [Planctomycetes bacterium]|nr:hypothetical protein [Planctomycetota bacterium]
MAHKRKKHTAKVNTEGWMMSYADMATILLAMFIVLSTLGKDQTGASLQRGLESWKESRQFFGLPGFFSQSSQQVQMETRGPRYAVPDDELADPSDDQAATIDAEMEKLQRFLKNPGSEDGLSKLPAVRGQATLDFFEPLNARPPLLTAKHRERLNQIVPLLGKENYSITLIDWATMPVDSAITRAAEQANEIAKELQSGNAQVGSRRLSAIGQPWRYAFYQRPVFSVTIRRLENR